MPGRRRGRGQEKPAPLAPLPLTDLSEVQKKIAAEKKEEADPKEEVEQVLLHIVPHKELNYSLLHNGRGLFEQLKLTNLTNKKIRGLELEVKLHLGEDTFPYRRKFDLEKESDDLAKDELDALAKDEGKSKREPITAPLISRLGRSLRESTRTNLYVKVAWQGRTLHSQTYSVRLLAVDEWCDDDRDRQWLPSFVHSGDPIVIQVINSARNYLKALCDDFQAAFDGYQQVQAEEEDNSVTKDEKEAKSEHPVYRQVKAIWHSVLHDLSPAYSNPPPTFTRYSQRLRTPSQVVNSRQGTCIDLALLMAACLEYVDIYPVIFLFPDHAFVGYWRSLEDYDDFMKPGGWSGAQATSTDSPNQSGGTGAQRVAWVFSGPEAYTEIMACAHDGRLVVIESTVLTQGKGFQDALDEGVAYLSESRDSFDAMIDVRRARDEGVTPLPLCWDEPR